MLWFGRNRSPGLVHLLYLLGAVFLAIASVSVLLILSTSTASRFLKDWHYITDVYLDVHASVTGERAAVRQVAQANNPDFFTEEMGYVTFGEGTHFAVEIQPGMEYTEIITQVVSMYDASVGKRHLPYPPQMLRCVHLAYVEKPDAVIFLGYHKDMYSAEWVVHIGEQAPFSNTFIKLISQLECDLTLIYE